VGVTGAGRAFVTAVAASTCCGVGAERFLARFREGAAPGAADGSGDRPGAWSFGPIDVDIAQWVHVTRTEDPLTLQLLAAVAADLRPHLERLGPEGLGIILGNTSGNDESYRQFYCAGVRSGPARVNPALLPATLVNYQAAQLSNALRLMGQSTTLSSGDCCGLDAIGQAALRLRLGMERAILAGGVQTLHGAAEERLRAAGLVSPSGRVRPGDPRRDGTVPSEAVGLLLLEGRAGRRAATEILGWSSGSAACGADGPEAAAAVVRAALEASGVAPPEVGFVFGAANGTAPVDDLERAALRSVFGAHLGRVTLRHVKRAAGECVVAAGPLQCIAAADALRGGSGSASGGPHALVVCVGLDRSCSALVLGRSAEAA
jgi:3-oxoacyl-(acyl-carrier-protein) synthase